MSLQLHRPDGKGGVEPRTVPEPDWRRALRSPRWGTSRGDDRPPRMSNPEMNPTRTPMAVAVWVGLGIATLLVLIAGYGSGFWEFR